MTLAGMYASAWQTANQVVKEQKVVAEKKVVAEQVATVENSAVADQTQALEKAKRGVTEPATALKKPLAAEQAAAAEKLAVAEQAAAEQRAVAEKTAAAEACASLNQSTSATQKCHRQEATEQNLHSDAAITPLIAEERTRQSYPHPEQYKRKQRNNESDSDIKPHSPRQEVAYCTTAFKRASASAHNG